MFSRMRGQFLVCQPVLERTWNEMAELHLVVRKFPFIELVLRNDAIMLSNNSRLCYLLIPIIVFYMLR